MKVKYIKPTEPFMLTNGKVYTVLAIERKWQRVVDYTGEDYLYPPESFEIVDDSDMPEEKYPNK